MIHKNGHPPKLKLMTWISVKDKLPEIPEGKHGVSVLTALFDSVYEEISPGHGYTVSKTMYFKIRKEDRDRWHYPENVKADFMDFYYDSTGIGWCPCADPITHWMPMPEPPEVEK